MNLAPHTPEPNGYHPAPPAESGAFFAARPQTLFPPEASGHSLDQILYKFGHAHVAGIPLLRLLWAAEVLLALLWLNGLPGGFWASGATLAVLVTLTALHLWRQGASFVTFRPNVLPDVTPAALAPADKQPVWVTGRLAVGGRERSFTWLPGFYRSFATREHALLCLCRSRRLALIGRWPEAEVGMWYAFFRSGTMQSLRWGELQFGRNHAPALEIVYKPDPLPPKRRLIAEATLYIACADMHTAHAILADLLADALPVGQATLQRR